ncbi:MAG: adenylate/guanylate cyclase domain-containing protein [Candidatus Cloacimonetes bacterium]|nr:adenylate/guanylate cyclase domain-containing protein [Candidatus Cloacimonadota bacterium]
MKRDIYFIIIILTIFGLLTVSCKKSDNLSKDKFMYKKLLIQADRIIQSRSALDSLITIADNLLQIDKSSNSTNKDISGMAYKYKGIFYYFLEDFEQANDYYKKASNIFKISNNYLELNKIYSNQGLIYLSNNQLDKALEKFLDAAQIDEQYLNEKSLDRIYINIGITYLKMNNMTSAHQYFLKAQLYANQLNNKYNEMNALVNLITTYSFFENYEDAISSAYRAEQIAISTGMQFYLGSIYNNLASVYDSMNEPEKSLLEYKKAFEIKEQLNDFEDIIKTANNIIALLTKLNRIDEAENFRNKVYDLSDKYDIKLESFQNFYSIGDYFYEIKQFKKASDIYKETLLKSLMNYDLNIHQQIAELEKKYDSEKKDNKINLLEKESEINKLKYDQQRQILVFFVLVLILILLLAYFILKMYINKTKDNILINRERDISEKLLLNVLPEKVLQELKLNGEYHPEVFSNCAVLFADIVNFTKISENLNPRILIQELNDIFTEFDYIFSRNHCERIKTNGDSYIGVCGLPEHIADNSDKLLKSAIEMRQYLNNRNQTNNLKWEVRFGLHTGTVIAAITGVKKYVFDIFGDTVNLTSRIQNIADPMEITVSEDFYLHLKIKYIFNHKIIINIKGKGEIPVYILSNEDNNEL